MKKMLHCWHSWPTACGTGQNGTCKAEGYAAPFGSMSFQWGGCFLPQNPLSVKNLSCFMEKYGRKFREINKMFNFMSGKYYFLRVKWDMLIDCSDGFGYNTVVCEPNE